MTLRTTITMIATLLAPAAYAQDSAAGEQLFKKCAGCHQAGDGATNRVGPVLTNVIGRTAGTFPDYRYGSSMAAAGEAGLVWTEDTIFDYLENPRNFLRAFLDDPRARAKMSFRLRDEADRRDVIAYLATFQVAMAEPVNGFCVQNGSDQTHVFTVDNQEGERAVAELAPGEVLCTTETASLQSGFVSVFENAEALEGCSRLVETGNVETLIQYADFDRCEWSSHTES